MTHQKSRASFQKKKKLITFDFFFFVQGTQIWKVMLDYPEKIILYYNFKKFSS